MTWKNEWSAIAARIDLLTNAGNTLMQMFAKDNQDPLSMSGRLIQQSQDVETNLENFAVLYKNLLPQSASRAIESFIAASTRGNPLQLQPMQNMSSRLVGLRLLLSEVNYHLSDSPEVIKRQSERAFLHLQQLLVADSEARKRWETAFDAGETACEKLGAAHLLYHGIYAFKVHTSQARTDLIFNELINNNEQIARVADGLVLTEWKKVEILAATAKIAEEARKQTTIYNAGVLGGIELKEYRYIVLVSKKQLPAIADTSENGVTYRHINIAVEPAIPSVAAKN